MRQLTRIVAHALAVAMCASASVQAQTTAPPPAPPATDGWRIAVYPILAWIPFGIGIDVDLPPFDGNGGGNGSIVDGRFDGAFLGGMSVSNGAFRVDADVMWAAVSGDRIERPHIVVDGDIIYGHGMDGFAVAPDVYVTGGVRRLAVDYDIKLADFPNFSRKPGVWDPLVGIGWHRERKTLDFHATFEGGGFGAGADVDIGAAARFDWKPTTHFGLTAGYGVLYFKVTDTISNRTFVVKQQLH